MINLDEAIKHCEEVAEEQENKAKVLNGDFYQSRRSACIECASEHRQLAEWLKELKQRRNYRNGCLYCKYKFRSYEDKPCIICSHNYTDKFTDDRTREVSADGVSN